MLVQGKQLFSTVGVDNYIEKFEGKLIESNNKIDQLRVDIVKCEEEIDSCMEVDILEGTASSKKDLSNISARNLNLQSQLDTEIQKVTKIKAIMDRGIAELMPEANKQLLEDMKIFNDTVEKESYRKLGQLREQQEEILLALQVAHSEVVTKLFDFDSICNLFEITRYKKNPSNNMFHSHLHMAHREFPEFGIPVIDCNNLQGIEERLFRTWADVNALANTNLPKDQRIEIPQPKKLQDINLQDYIDNLKCDKEDKE